MPRTRPLPGHAHRVTTYAELDQFLQGFAAGGFNLLFVIGRPGLQKSRGLRDVAGAGACWLEGHNSALGAYMKLYRHRNCQVIVDDADYLCASPGGLELLRSLCQTETLKTLHWNTSTKILDDEGIPREFTTASKAAIVANAWAALKPGVAALLDRGHLVNFDPEPLEVHRRATGWFWDEEVFDFVADNLSFTAGHSMRTYKKAWELKRAGLDWRKHTLDLLIPDPTARLVAQILADTTLRTEADRLRAFRDLGGGSRSTFYAHKKELRAAPAVPKMTLANTTPPDQEEAAALAEAG